MSAKKTASAKGKAAAPVSNAAHTGHNGVAYEGELPGVVHNVFAALQTNIEESFDEIEILRGSLQYWESRPASTDLKERAMLTEAFRVMFGELVGLTARAKALAEREEAAAAAAAQR